MARQRRLCGSRNTTTGEPCRLPEAFCKYPAHREPDKARARRRAKAAKRAVRRDAPAAPTLGSAAPQPATVHPGGPTTTQLQQMLLQHQRGVLNPATIERDYWMFQVTRMMQADSVKYPGSPACMSGGSMLALVGITERLSEDADFTVTFPGGLPACSNSRGKNLLDEYQNRVAAGLGVTATRPHPGGGNMFRQVLYRYGSAVGGQAHRDVKSDLGIRSVDPRYIVTLPAQPYLSRAGASLPAAVAAGDIRCMHPITTLVDKLDATCVREQAPNQTPQEALTRLAARVRDHYDLYMLIGWLTTDNQINAQGVQDAVAHMQRSGTEVRARRNVNRPALPPPAGGYRTLRVWQPGTAEYQQLQAVYPTLRSVVYGTLPPWPDVAARIRGCPYI